MVALVAYFAAKATQAREQLAQAQQVVQQQQQMLTSLQQKVGAYEAQLNQLRDPGRTTDLPGVDQGKSAMVTLDDENVKTHGQPLFQGAFPS